MSQNATLAYVLDRVERVYGRMTNELKESLAADINQWVDRLCRRYQFWFLEATPSEAFVNLFPFLDPVTGAPLPSTVPVGGVGGSQWPDRGWCLSSLNQATYRICHPRSTSYSQANNSNVGPGIDWAGVEVKRINYFHLYNLAGEFRAEVPVIDRQTFLRNAQFKLAGSLAPKLVSWSTEAPGYSTLLISPKPSVQYLMAISYQLATLPPLEEPDSSHDMLAYYPGALITAGIIEAAKYFGEPRELEQAHIDLYGGEYAKGGNSNMLPGGLVGDMIADTRLRDFSDNSEMRVYASSVEALGRGQNVRRVMWGKYYTDGTV